MDGTDGMDERMDGMNEWMDGWMIGGWMDVCMDGWE